MLASSASLQTSAALATTVFALYGPSGTGALRFAIAAPVLMLLVRPTLRGRSLEFWMLALASGAALVALNFALYAAIARAPLGTVVTVQFLGPLAVALVGSRRRRLDLLWIGAAAAGVLAVAGAAPSGSPGGLALALLAAGLTVVVLALNRGLIGRSSGLDGLVFEVGAAAVLTLPVAAHAIVKIDAAADLGLVALVAVLGIAVPYALEYTALKAVSVKTFSVLLSLDPAVAAIAGAVWLGQLFSPVELLGIFLVVTASAGIITTRPSE